MKREKLMNEILLDIFFFITTAAIFVMWIHE
jgi:hypothetical protein